MTTKLTTNIVDNAARALQLGEPAR